MTMMDLPERSDPSWQSCTRATLADGCRVLELLGSGHDRR